MNTKIEGLQPPLPRPSGGAAKPAAAPGPGAGSASAEDSVKLSGDTVDIAAIARNLGGGSTLDAAKVAAVRTALDTGTYRIDAQEIAIRLTQLERQLGG